MGRVLKRTSYLIGVVCLLVSATLVYFWQTWPPYSTENRLVEYVRDGNIQKVEEIIRSGADVNKPGKWRGMMSGAEWRDGRTPLTQAALSNRITIAEFLITMGANLNKHDGFGQTAVHASSQHGHHEITEFFISKGCDLNRMQLDNSFSALANAALIARDKELVRLLLKNGAILTGPAYMKKDIVKFVNETQDKSLTDLLSNANKAPQPTPKSGAAEL